MDLVRKDLLFVGFFVFPLYILWMDLLRNQDHKCSMDYDDEPDTVHFLRMFPRKDQRIFASHMPYLEGTQD